MADRPPFIKATQDLLGEDGVHWLLTYKPMQDSSAFRFWCKANGYNLEEYNEVAKNIDNYRTHPQWEQVIEDSKRFLGVIESVSPSPCSFLLLDKPISSEVGILKVGEEYCANLDGYNCDVYKYLKNDYLSVTVWLIISEVCKLAGIQIPSIRELNNLLDEKTYMMYELGLTATLNQADTDFGTECVKRLKPKTVGEVSAFVASIRPGFASLLNNFLDRKPYTTGVQELDELLKDSYHYLMYQESIMKFLVWLGMPESQTYDIIKKISKKKFDVQELIELKQTLLENWVRHIGTEEGFNESWQVVEDAAHYSFNASHSLSVGLDSLYGAYLKSHYPLEYYTVTLNIFKDDIPRTTKLVDELNYFKISLKPAQFGYSKAEYFCDRETRTIYKGVGSIKYLNNQVADDLYNISQFDDYNDFYEVLDELKEIKINSRQLDILIKIGYFREFGKTKKLLKMVEYYNTFNKKTYKMNHPYAQIILNFSDKNTDKTISEVDNRALLRYLLKSIDNVEIPVNEIVQAQMEYMGTVEYKSDELGEKACSIVYLDTKYTPKVKLYRLFDGKIVEAKVSTKFYNENPIKLYDIVKLTKVTAKDKRKKENNSWVLTGEKDYFIEYCLL